MKPVAMFAIVLGLGLAGPLVRADDVTLESVPPVVVKTVPAAGADDVDPKLTEIKVTFSKDMQDGTWSWSTVSEGTFPEATGKAKYLDDKRTCVLPVKLEPGKTYAIWVNSEQFTNFKDADGRSAVPYLLVFKTKK
jgi:RNA polymerase sigma-70 factor (ECF subfamily)